MARTKLMSITEVAEQKECTRQAVHDAIKSGKLDAEQVGRYYVVRMNSRFQKWMPDPKRQIAGGIRRTKEGKRAE